jgi:membrane associated rhomboid family serine protease
MGKSLDAIKVLIVANIAFFAAANLLPELRLGEWLALYYPENKSFHVWQLVTTMFMHGGFAHILFNMYALWAFGTPLEYLWGYKRFLVFYFLSGIGASVIYLLVNYFQFHAIYDELIQLGATASDIDTYLNSAKGIPISLASFPREKLYHLNDLFTVPAVGASGAIYGVLVAFGMSYPNSKLALIFFPVPIAAKYFIPILIGLDLFSGVTGVSIFGGGIAHFAHIGGAIIGFLLMWFWRNKQPQY